MFNRPLIAIDFGSSSVKVVEISGGSSKKLRALGLELVPHGVIADGVIRDIDTVLRVTSGLLRKLKVMTLGRRAAVALSGSAVIIKKATVNLSKDTPLSEQVYYEAEQHFQVDMSELYYDFWEIGRSDDGNQAQVLLVGAKRDVVEQYIDVVRRLGMRVGVVDCDAFSITNMFEYNYGVTDQMIALANIGASHTTVSLILGGRYLYTREIGIGGDEYSRQIAQALNVDRDNAEVLKVSSSMGETAPPEEVQRVISSLNEQLVAEIQTSVDFFFQSGEAPPNVRHVSCVFLSGGSSRLLGLDGALAAGMQVPVRLINPFQKVDINPRRFQMDYVLMQGHLYSVAVGLAIRSLGDGK